MAHAPNTPALAAEYKVVIQAKFVTERDGSPKPCFACATPLVLGDALACKKDDSPYWDSYCAECAASFTAQVRGIYANIQTLVTPMGEAIPQNVQDAIVGVKPVIQALLADENANTFLAAKHALVGLRRLVTGIQRNAAANADRPDVAAGHYAVKSATGNNDLDFYRVDRPTKGKWEGYTFVKRVIGGQADTAVRGAEALSALKRIAADADAGARYGQEIGRCYKCNRHLTDELSRSLGIGPECRKSL